MDYKLSSTVIILSFKLALWWALQKYFPADHKMQQKDTEQGLWEAHPLFSPMKAHDTEGEGRVVSLNPEYLTSAIPLE